MKQNDYDTIFASSSQSRSAIKIIRISGNNAKKTSSIFNFKRPAPRTFALRKLIHKCTMNDSVFYSSLWFGFGFGFGFEDVWMI